MSHTLRARTVLTKSDGFPLVDVVMASCAVPGVWPAVALGPDRFSDAGFLSDAHADLLGGEGRVLVVEPVPNIGGRYADAELAVLHRAVRLAPDEEATTALGQDPFDGTRRAAAAQAGFAQGVREWPRIEAVL